MKKISNSIIELIGNTPMVRINNLSDPRSSAEILAKLEFFNPGGSVKDRPCIEMIEDQ
jgi:cysteine synthase